MGLLGNTSSIVIALVAAALFFILFISVVSAPDYLPHANMHYGSLNTSQTLQMYNTTYLKVYYSSLCPACSEQMPILEEFADNGTLVTMIDADQEADETEKDFITTTPTIFVIDGTSLERLEGLSSREDILNTMEMVRNKSKPVEG